MVQTYRGLIPRSSYPVDEPFGVHAEYLNDADPFKVNLSIGTYRTDEGLPWPLPVVDQVEKYLQSKQDTLRHEYLPIQGDLKFLDLARDLAFDFGPCSRSEDAQRARIVSAQTVSGTGANHVGAKYLADVLKPPRVWLPNPTWTSHHTIWQVVGTEVRMYPYYDERTRGVDFTGMTRVLSADAQPGDVVLFHACAHNPTGSDPSKEQWISLAKLCRGRGLVPFFDFAYQGFASGDVSEDAWAIRHFFSQPDLEFCVAQSFSKTFGIYGQRTGALHVVVGRDSVRHRNNVLSTLCHLIRSEYSMAPRAGSDIVRTTLGHPLFRDQWLKDLSCMTGRIKTMRKALYDELVRLGTPGSWIHIVHQTGMFSYTGLSEAQVMTLRTKYHIYMLRSGRISMSGLSMKNVRYAAKAFDDVVRTVD